MNLLVGLTLFSKNLQELRSHVKTIGLNTTSMMSPKSSLLVCPMLFSKNLQDFQPHDFVILYHQSFHPVHCTNHLSLSQPLNEVHRFYSEHVCTTMVCRMHSGGGDDTQVLNNDGNSVDDSTNNMDIHNNMSNSMDDANTDTNMDTSNRSHNNSNYVRMDNILSTNMDHQCGKKHPTLDHRKPSNDVNSNGRHRKIPPTTQFCLRQ